MSLLPQRSMTYIKSHYPSEKFETVFGELWVAMWEQHMDLSNPEKMAECLSRHFDANDVNKILEGANDKGVKQELNDTTKKALDSGAYGCPWFIVKSKTGAVEPFFGSDRSVSLGLFPAMDMLTILSILGSTTCLSIWESRGKILLLRRRRRICEYVLSSKYQLHKLSMPCSISSYSKHPLRNSIAFCFCFNLCLRFHLRAHKSLAQMN
jgi:hypothetical protein